MGYEKREKEEKNERVNRLFVHQMLKYYIYVGICIYNEKLTL